MFWRKWTARKNNGAGARAGRRERRLHEVPLGDGMFTLTLPEGTVVEEHAPGVGWFRPPDSRGELRFSISSYDVELHGLEDRRPAEAALGEGEALGPVSAVAAPVDDYGTILDVVADDGPYAKFGGNLMRLWRHEGRYLRAFRIAVAKSRDLERAREYLGNPGVAPASTAIDLDQHDPNAALVFVGGYFSMTLPPDWTAHVSEEGAEDDDEDDDGSERYYGLAPDQRLLVEIRVVEQWSEEPQTPEQIIDLLAANTKVELGFMEENGQSGGVPVLEDDFRLVATAGMRSAEGRRERLYAAESLSSRHRVYANYWLTALVDDMEDAEWKSGVEKVEHALRGAHFHHPRLFTVGEDD